MSVQIEGIVFKFNLKTSYEVQPGSVPGPGGLADHYICEGCGWEYEHRVWGYFNRGEQDELRQKLVTALDFHQSRCPRIRELKDDS